MKSFPILMYHRIASARCPVPGGVEEARYAIDLEMFVRQMTWLSKNGMAGVALAAAVDRLQAGRPVPPEWVVLTFDDGNESDAVHAVPVLEPLGFGATFFVGTARIDAPGGLPRQVVSDMAGRGFDVGSHGVRHRFLSSLSPQDERRELEESRSVLGSVTGRAVRFFSAPGGRIGRRGLAAARRAGYEAVCTSVFGFNDAEHGRFDYKRIPVTDATPFGLFLAAATRRRGPLSTQFARSAVLDGARRLLGERLYARLRSTRIGQ